MKYKLFLKGIFLSVFVLFVLPGIVGQVFTSPRYKNSLFSVNNAYADNAYMEDITYYYNKDGYTMMQFTAVQDFSISYRTWSAGGCTANLDSDYGTSNYGSNSNIMVSFIDESFIDESYMMTCPSNNNTPVAFNFDEGVTYTTYVMHYYNLCSLSSAGGCLLNETNYLGNFLKVPTSMSDSTEYLIEEEPSSGPTITINIPNASSTLFSDNLVQYSTFDYDFDYDFDYELNEFNYISVDLYGGSTTTSYDLVKSFDIPISTSTGNVSGSINLGLIWTDRYVKIDVGFKKGQGVPYTYPTTFDVVSTYSGEDLGYTTFIDDFVNVRLYYPDFDYLLEENAEELLIRGGLKDSGYVKMYIDSVYYDTFDTDDLDALRDVDSNIVFDLTNVILKNVNVEGNISFIVYNDLDVPQNEYNGSITYKVVSSLTTKEGNLFTQLFDLGKQTNLMFFVPGSPFYSAVDVSKDGLNLPFYDSIKNYVGNYVSKYANYIATKFPFSWVYGIYTSLNDGINYGKSQQGVTSFGKLSIPVVDEVVADINVGGLNDIPDSVVDSDGWIIVRNTFSMILWFGFVLYIMFNVNNLIKYLRD